MVLTPYPGVFRGSTTFGCRSLTTLYRMYTSTFADWFSQAVIDFMLGNRTTSVFSEFLLKLQSTDPRDLIRITKIRSDAIATCVSRVLPEWERLLSGWTLFAPEDLSTKMGDKFEEKVLLLVGPHLLTPQVLADPPLQSAKALYIIVSVVNHRLGHGC